MNILLTQTSGYFKQKHNSKKVINADGQITEARIAGKWYSYTMIGDVPNIAQVPEIEQAELNKAINE